MLETVTGPGSNHENLESSFDGASDIIMEGLNALCAKAGIGCYQSGMLVEALRFVHPYFVPNILSPASPKPGRITSVLFPFPKRI